MSKVVRLYRTFNNDAELVESNEGYWFFRKLVFNPYIKHKVFGSWIYLGKLKSIKHDIINYEDKGHREITEYNIGFIFEEYFTELCPYVFKYRGGRSKVREEDKVNYRLPNIAKYKLDI